MGRTEIKVSLRSTDLSMEAGDSDQRGQEMPAGWSLQRGFPLALLGSLVLQLGGGETAAAEAGLVAPFGPWASPPAQGSLCIQTSRDPKAPAPLFTG